MTAPHQGQARTRALWRLEWWRLVRTHRIVALVGIYLFFGATAAPMARYMGELVQRFGGGVQVILPPPLPADGFSNYVSNANQLGLLVFVIIVSSALTLDARPETAIFLRTRVRRSSELVVPRFAVNVAAGASAFCGGALCTWYGTVLLLGDVDGTSVMAGMLLQSLYLAFHRVGGVGARLAPAQRCRHGRCHHRGGAGAGAAGLDRADRCVATESPSRCPVGPTHRGGSSDLRTIGRRDGRRDLAVAVIGIRSSAAREM